MLNKDGIRELAYVVRIDAIEPIVGSDNCEAAVVGGWRVMVKKETFKVGDLAIYFEIDSKVPEIPEFEFLLKKHYKVKTQKYTFGGKGNFISQGLLMHPSDFGWEVLCQEGEGPVKIVADKKYYKLGDFLTEDLGVTYSVVEDNKRKSGTDKYSKMRARHQKLFRKNKLVQWLWKREWGKKVLFLFLGKKKDKRGWPDWVRKTDEERCQNLPQLFPGDNTKWIVTEKIDGTSTTFTYKRRGRNKGFYVCSRNVCFDTPEKAENCFYESNVYLEMAQKYNAEAVLKDLMEAYPEYDFVTIQGETFGKGIQNRTYGLEDHDFRAFNLIVGNDINDQERIDTIAMKNILKDYNIETVPVLETDFNIPETCDELLTYSEGKSEIDGKEREGVVLRTKDGKNSFKAVSNNFLLKYHQ